MSYLDTVRLHFAGGFFSDPSTVNNDPAHYDNAAFDRSKYWLRQDASGANGWWNPEGAHSFRFQPDVAVTAGYYSDGSTVTAAGDSLLRFHLESRGRNPSKMVDLDPDQQMVSMIFGLRVALVDAQGLTAFEGTFEPAPFTDIWGRGRDGPETVGGDERASVGYQSIITVDSWGAPGGSRFLQQLRQAASENILSIKFNLDGYSMDPSDAGRFATGRIVGTIGPGASAEPRHWVRGRHLGSGAYPWGAASPGFTPPANFGIAVHDPQRMKVRLDLGNALPIDVAAALPPHSPVQDLGPLALGCLQPDGSIAMIAPITYGGASWYEKSAGIVEVPADRPLSGAETQLLLANRLCVVAEAKQATLLAESASHVRADMFVARLNPGETVAIRLAASRLGRPFSNGRIDFVHLGPPGADAQANFPLKGLPLPGPVACDANGEATLTLTAADPGNPRFFFDQDGTRRQFPDGQVYRVAYELEGTPNANPSDFLSVLVWNEFTPDDPPTWYGSMREVFTLYANLYPWMAKRGPQLDLADYDRVNDEKAGIIQVLSLDPANPHYMPVSRDLSRTRRIAMLRWLQQPGLDGKPLKGVPRPAPAAIEGAPRLAVPASAPVKGGTGGKTRAGLRLRMVRLGAAGLPG